MSSESRNVFFDPVETGSLRAVYLLALVALSATHYVDTKLQGHLANAAFEAYINARLPPLPLSSTQTEDMAVFSIELLALSHGDLLISKH